MRIRKLVCYGDSNTYGYDPRCYAGDILSTAVRWTGRLNAMPEWLVTEYGSNGRQIPTSPPEFAALDQALQKEAPLDCLIVMLGSNDALFMPSPTPQAVGDRMEELISRTLALPAMKNAAFLLVAPPRAALEGMDWRCGIISKLGRPYAALAEKYGVEFADAGSWGPEMAFDGIHMSPEGHRLFAEKIDEKLKMIFSQQ